jgi:hypothetical protein
MRNALVVLRSYSHRIPAELAQGALEASGLTAFLEVGPYGPGHEAFRVDLLVKAEDSEKALEILGPETSN